MDFFSAIKEGKVVVVAGAGISKEAPSNLPSWWDYNTVLLQEIGELGAKCLGQNDNLLCVKELMENLPVVSISEFIVNRIVGNSYYPLISLLDGAEPNINHLVLAQLAQSNSIRAIVTTNFDTLLEKAFEQKGVSYKRFDSPADFDRAGQNTLFPIYKIHGSADNTDYAIDTVHQKLPGLSIEKKEVLIDLFTDNHILFIGFSGEDYLFGSDYIPIQNNKEGITWIAYPGSSINERTTAILSELNAKITYSKLPDFYQSNGWELPVVNHSASSDSSSFIEKAEQAVRTLFLKPHIGEAACLGMCINILDAINDTQRAEQIIKCTDEYISRNRIKHVGEMRHISLLSALAVYAQCHDDLEKALSYSEMQLRIFQKEDNFYQTYKIGSNNQKLRAEQCFNRATVINRMGLIYNQKGEYLEALSYFSQALRLAYQAMSFEHIASVLFGIGIAKSNLKNEDYQNGMFAKPHFMVFLECARRIAEHGGCVQIQFDINCALVQLYSAYGQKELMEQAYQKAVQLQEICIFKQRNTDAISHIQSYRETCPESVPWPNDHFPFSEPCDPESTWSPFSQRPVLSCPEGKEAKRLFDNEEYNEFENYLVEAINDKINNKQIADADYLLDSYIGILSQSAKAAADVHDFESNAYYLKRIKECLETCISLEIQMLRIDYFAESLGSLAELNFFVSDDSDLDNICFLAELTLCFSTDPKECWQSIKAMRTACNAHYKQGRYKAAMQYCHMYLDTVGRNRNVETPNQINFMRHMYVLLNQLIRETHPI